MWDQREQIDQAEKSLKALCNERKTKDTQHPWPLDHKGSLRISDWTSCWKCEERVFSRIWNGASSPFQRDPVSSLYFAFPNSAPPKCYSTKMKQKIKDDLHTYPLQTTATTKGKVLDQGAFAYFCWVRAEVQNPQARRLLGLPKLYPPRRLQQMVTERWSG